MVVQVSVASTSRQQVYVMVTDVNVRLPTFSRNVYMADVMQNKHVGVAQLVIAAYNDDNERLSYSAVGPLMGRSDHWQDHHHHIVRTAR